MRRCRSRTAPRSWSTSSPRCSSGSAPGQNRRARRPRSTRRQGRCRSSYGGPRSLGTTHQQSARAPAPMGTLMKNTQCQLAYSTRKPPSVGPTAAATPPSAPQRPTAMPCCRRGKTLKSMASEIGAMAAPPTPWSHAKTDQPVDVGGEAAGQRGDAEHGQAGEEHQLQAEPVAEAPHGEEEHGQRQAVGVDDPRDGGDGRVQVLDDRRDGDVDDGDVEQRHEHAEETAARISHLWGWPWSRAGTAGAVDGATVT